MQGLTVSKGRKKNRKYAVGKSDNTLTGDGNEFHQQGTSCASDPETDTKHLQSTLATKYYLNLIMRKTSDKPQVKNILFLKIGVLYY